VGQKEDEGYEARVDNAIEGVERNDWGIKHQRPST
jgi:hypothetical protein